MGLSKRASELAIESLAGTAECLMTECREQKHEMDNLRESVVQQRAMRQEDVDSAAQANADMSDLREDRDRLLRKLAQAECHNDILRGQVEQLQAELTKARIASLYLPDDWRKTVAENLAAQKRFEERRAEREKFGTVAENLRAQDGWRRGKYFAQKHWYEHGKPLCGDDSTINLDNQGKINCIRCQAIIKARRQAIDDSAEPQFTAQEMSDAAAVVEADLELERTAHGEPVTEECPQCGGIGSFDLGRTPLAKGIGKLKCDRCKGTGHVLVADESPKLADAEREMTGVEG